MISVVLWTFLPPFMVLGFIYIHQQYTAWDSGFMVDKWFKPIFKIIFKKQISKKEEEFNDLMRKIKEDRKKGIMDDAMVYGYSTKKRRSTIKKSGI